MAMKEISVTGNVQDFIIVHPKDNIAVAVRDLEEGTTIQLGNRTICLVDSISSGHKLALLDIDLDEHIIKFGSPIGSAKRFIKEGEHVHTHNVRTNLKGLLEYTYIPDLDAKVKKADLEERTFMGYRRKNGDVGIRNEIWLINTTGCVNHTIRMLEKQALNKYGSQVDDIYAVQHSYGCSQLGGDHLNTQKVLAGLVNHPNAAGVLIVSLGCENNNITEFKKVLGDYDPERVKIMITQDEPDELVRGMELIDELVDYAIQFKREPIPVSNLVVGFKCGASDGFSGLTANPLVGTFSDKLVELGGTGMLTEVPEMFGAEEILMNRCKDEKTFHETVSLINNFKNYYINHGEEISENPAPGNIKGGITTLEEKSLGCIQKGGSGAVTSVLKYGESVEEKGLCLLEGPGNDPISITALTVSGAHLILFTTGRGNPLGAPIPTVKISSNNGIYERKSSWIDFNAGRMLEGESRENLTEELFEFVIRVASGEMQTKNEMNGFKDISIFKDGVIL
jgi:altronate hydrolase